ncbi:methylated-DNA--[protein]-cysteine S-methyltransferase [Paenibacillus sp. N1-5-1-14]|uniref:methylated-DNA--[protein]-cysteine S-methyltransferase n=1 Tax=Paenibacillus radicibacter TaxID=2972488 RepID=UPI0021593803|nr:methylated-DNA--[protein]-cysteine S-methyltransferase [Paenibacillus radicibacter]MCR8643083.1 methylated-DNA--[protein]-cysteine S-methyltransferase [Paenibacillus radicibacter]
MDRAKVTKLYWDEMLDTPIGPLALAATDEGLCSLSFSNQADAEPKVKAWASRYVGDYEWEHSPERLRHVFEQLEAYFTGDLTEFNVELDLRGTDFQMRVWQALRGIPYGCIASYKDIAIAVGSPKGVRAVGGANHNNPVALIVPCHRVIGANGAMVGFGGGLPIKESLLKLEGYLLI